MRFVMHAPPSPPSIPCYVSGLLSALCPPSCDMVRFSPPFGTKFQYYFVVLSHTDIYHRCCATSNAGSVPPPRPKLPVLILDYHAYCTFCFHIAN